MKDEEQKPSKAGKADTSDAEIEREIRSRRKFSLAEAIGRSAGDLMKGASPVTRKQQAEFEIEELIDHHLEDAEGAISVVLLRRVKASEALLDSYDTPSAALVQVLQDLLGSEDTLRRFVVKVDAEWGHIYLERPHFETDTRPPDADDPYTRDSVRKALTGLLTDLESDVDEHS
jgi:hypothetical protein